MAVLLPHENILIGLNVKKPKNNVANNSELGRMLRLLDREIQQSRFFYFGHF